MNAAKIALSVPFEVLRLAKKEVAAGRAKSLSAFVSEAMDVEYGRPTAAAKTWAKSVLKRSSYSGSP
jgi:hypothetical protein